MPENGLVDSDIDLTTVSKNSSMVYTPEPQEQNLVHGNTSTPYSTNTDESRNRKYNSSSENSKSDFEIVDKSGDAVIETIQSVKKRVSHNSSSDSGKGCNFQEELHKPYHKKISPKNGVHGNKPRHPSYKIHQTGLRSHKGQSHESNNGGRSNVYSSSSGVHRVSDRVVNCMYFYIFSLWRSSYSFQRFFEKLNFSQTLIS